MAPAWPTGPAAFARSRTRARTLRSMASKVISFHCPSN